MRNWKGIGSYTYVEYVPYYIHHETRSRPGFEGLNGEKGFGDLLLSLEELDSRHPSHFPYLLVFCIL